MSRSQRFHGTFLPEVPMEPQHLRHGLRSESGELNAAELNAAEA